MRSEQPEQSEGDAKATSELGKVCHRKIDPDQRTRGDNGGEPASSLGRSPDPWCHGLPGRGAVAPW